MRSDDGVGSRGLGKQIELSSNPVGRHEIVAVEEGREFASRLSQTSIPRRRDSTVFLTENAHPWLVFAAHRHEVEALVARSVVDDDALDQWICLVEHAVHRIHDAMGAIEHRHDDAHQRVLAHSSLARA